MIGFSVFVPTETRKRKISKQTSSAVWQRQKERGCRFYVHVYIFLVHFLAVVVEELLVHLEPWKIVVGHEMYTA